MFYNSLTTANFLNLTTNITFPCEKSYIRPIINN